MRPWRRTQDRLAGDRHGAAGTRRASGRAGTDVRLGGRGASENRGDVPRADDRRPAADSPQCKYATVWPFIRERNDRKHAETIQQEIGDCVSHGWAHGLHGSLAAHLVMRGKDASLTKPFPPYIYGASRAWIGKGQINPNEDGSIGGWAAAAVQDESIGILPENAEGVPPYSGAVAKEWGRRGPPAKYRELAKQYRARCNLVTTWPQLVAAISSGYCVPTCSNQGFQMRAVERNGRLEGVAKGNWAHCTCFTGIDNRAGRQAAYLQNSWGPRAHASPEDYARLDGAQPGGFWVAKETVEKMLAAQDSYAVSFDGFAFSALRSRVMLEAPVPQKLWYAGCMPPHGEFAARNPFGGLLAAVERAEADHRALCREFERRGREERRRRDAEIRGLFEPSLARAKP
jgi:hypothetical protein